MKDVVSSDFLRVLMALKDNVMRDLCVAEVAKVLSVEGNDLYGYRANCEILSNGQQIDCYVRWKLHLKFADYVLVLFTDKDFKTNISSLKRGQEVKYIDDKTSTLHTRSYGIVTDIVWTERSCDANGDEKIE